MLCGASLPRVLGSVLRRRLPRVARWIVGDEPACGDGDVPQLGSPHAQPDLRRCAPCPGCRVVSLIDPTEAVEESTITIDSYLHEGQERSLADDVLDGLTRPFKELPPKHFYDARGAELFDRICELPEYYPTRTERAILEQAAGDLATLTNAV